MANKVLRTRIAQKYALASAWAESSLVLLKGELAIDELNRIKIGDGVKTWSELPFVVDGKATAISFPEELPAANSPDYNPGNLVLTPDGMLWCLVEENNVREWVDLTNKSDIQALQTGIVALQNEAEGLQTAVVALQTALEGNGADFAAELEAVKADVAVNVENIAANRADIDTIYDSASGKINSAVLPSFVDDVVEGLVCISDSDADATYNLTHNGDAVIGFFGASGTEDGSTRSLKFIAAGNPETANLSAVSYEENGITYTFPADPVADKVAPSSSIIYVDVRTNKTYRWSGSQFVVVASDLALGETASTAYAGDKGAEVYSEVFTAETGLKARTTALEARADALEAKDTAHEAALLALQSECETKHQALEDEFAAGIVALKQESEQKDAAHEASLVALQQQIESVNMSASAMTFNDVVSNSGDTLNDELIILDCGGAED